MRSDPSRSSQLSRNQAQASDDALPPRPPAAKRGRTLGGSRRAEGPTEGGIPDDPVLGQFLSPDPIIAQPFSQGLNRFAYVNNSPLNFTDPSGYTACPNRGARGCSASSGPGYATLGIGGGAIAVGAAAYGLSQLWAGPQAMGGVATTSLSPTPVGGGGAAEDLAALGPEDAGAAVPGPGNAIAAADSMSFNASIDARQPTKRMGLKPAGNANVGTNGGVPGRGAGADNAVAPVREGAVQEGIQLPVSTRTGTLGQNGPPVVCGQGGPICGEIKDVTDEQWHQAAVAQFLSHGLERLARALEHGQAVVVQQSMNSLGQIASERFVPERIAHGSNDQLKFSWRTGPTLELSFVVHTHPSSLADGFSDMDLLFARTHGVPVFAVSGVSNKLLMFDPSIGHSGTIWEFGRIPAGHFGRVLKSPPALFLLP